MDWGRIRGRGGRMGGLEGRVQKEKRRNRKVKRVEGGWEGKVRKNWRA